MSLDAIRQHIREQFERSHRLNAHPCASTNSLNSEISLADKAAPIFKRITATPAEHRRNDGLVYEIVEPKIENLDALFDEALVSLGFKTEVSR